jgi:hypothetical protein
MYLLLQSPRCVAISRGTLHDDQTSLTLLPWLTIMIPITIVGRHTALHFGCGICSKCHHRHKKCNLPRSACAPQSVGDISLDSFQRPQILCNSYALAQRMHLKTTAEDYSQPISCDPQVPPPALFNCLHLETDSTLERRSFSPWLTFNPVSHSRSINTLLKPCGTPADHKSMRSSHVQLKKVASSALDGWDRSC